MPARMSFSLPNMTKPTSGPVGVPVTLDFTSVTVISTDLALEQMQGVLEYAQSIYVDNSLNAQPLAITFSGLLYKLTIRAFRQGIFPVICAAGPLSFTAQTAGGVKIPIILFNVEMPYLVWDV